MKSKSNLAFLPIWAVKSRGDLPHLLLDNLAPTATHICKNETVSKTSPSTVREKTKESAPVFRVRTDSTVKCHCGFSQRFFEIFFFKIWFFSKNFRFFSREFPAENKLSAPQMKVSYLATRQKNTPLLRSAAGLCPMSFLRDPLMSSIQS